MEKNIKLEQYLGKLDKGLGSIPVSEKAEIITEIKSHILDAQAKDDSKKLEDILAAIGEPEFVANRYLIERGLKPMKTPTHPIFKWLIIGFLGTFAIIVLLITVLIWKFTPIMKIHDDKVTLLGGTIDVDKESQIYFNRSVNFGGPIDVEKQVFDSDKITGIHIINGSGDVKITSTKEKKSILEVGRKGHKCDLVTKLDAKGLLLVTTSEENECSLTYVNLFVPAKIEVNVETKSGDINIDKISGDITASAKSGNIAVFVENKTKPKLSLVTRSGNVLLDLPKGISVDYNITTHSGNVSKDFISKKGGDVNAVINTRSGNVVLKAR
jgi:predicted membrane protein